MCLGRGTKRLPCGHIFGLDCIMRAFNKPAQSCCCPPCRRQYNIEIHPTMNTAMTFRAICHNIQMRYQDRNLPQPSWLVPARVWRPHEQASTGEFILLSIVSDLALPMYIAVLHSMNVAGSLRGKLPSVGKKFAIYLLGVFLQVIWPIYVLSAPLVSSIVVMSAMWQTLRPHFEAIRRRFACPQEEQVEQP
jgi:hypothetical protein